MPRYRVKVLEISHCLLQIDVDALNEEHAKDQALFVVIKGIVDPENWTTR
jgi:hypothetical protein